MSDGVTGVSSSVGLHFCLRLISNRAFTEEVVKKVSFAC